MPESGAVLWAAICGGFGLLFLLVGTLVKMGFDGIRSEIQGLRSDINKYHDSEMETRGELKAHIQKCEERHRLLDAHYSLKR